MLMITPKWKPKLRSLTLHTSQKHLAAHSHQWFARCLKSSKIQYSRILLVCVSHSLTLPNAMILI